MNERDKELAAECYVTPSWEFDYKKFAELIRADEREACAVLAQQTICDTHIPTGINIYGTRAAKAIRARGNT
jgi:hypothetical protein